ncbi:MAG: hypothetical protein GY699_24250 [Desulfobacteraceae bacterium]|nr:hypothetical protein [Desulfobacteraceae bacterium]
MFNKNRSEGYRSTIKGIKQKTLVYGENTLMTELKLLRGGLWSNLDYYNIKEKAWRKSAKKRSSFDACWGNGV